MPLPLVGALMEIIMKQNFQDQQREELFTGSNTESKDLGLGEYKGSIVQKIAVIFVAILAGGIVAILALTAFGIIQF